MSKKLDNFLTIPPESTGPFSDDDLITALWKILSWPDLCEIDHRFWQTKEGKKLAKELHNNANKIKGYTFFDTFIDPFSENEVIKNIIYDSIDKLEVSRELKYDFEIFTSLFPGVAKLFGELVNLDGDMMQQAFLSIIDDLRAIYPQATKSLNYAMNSKQRQKNTIEQLKNRLYNTILHELQDRILPTHTIAVNIALFVGVLDFFYEHLEDLYSQYFRDICEELFSSSHKRKEEQKLQSQESPIKKDLFSGQKKVLYSWNAIIQTKIEEAVASFSLEEKRKKELISRLQRLYKNKKPVKKSDYFGENPRIAISSQDEEPFFNLINELGLKILDTPDTVEANNFISHDLSNEPWIAENPVQEEILDLKEQLFLPTLENVDEVLEYWITQLTSCGYTIKNKKQLFKQMKDFCVNDEKTWVLLELFSDSEKLKKLDKKNKWELYAISCSWKDGILRFLLQNTPSWKQVDSFFGDHNEYEKRIDYLAK